GLLGKVLPGRLRIKRELLRELPKDRIVLDDQVLAPNPPRLDRPCADRLLGIRDYELGNRARPASEPAAIRAGPLRVVEGKVARGQLLEDVAAHVARKVLAERNLPPRGLRALL